MRIKKTLKKLPFPIRQSAKYLYGLIPTRLRYGKVFWQTYNFLQESQWWSKEKLEEYQMQQLSKLLHHAYENVPYYRRVFDERNLKPKDIQDFNDLRKLPCLTKDIFKRHFSEFIARNFKLKNLPTSHTSGTTGKPLQFYENQDTNQKELAFIYHQWSRVKVKPGDLVVQLRGEIIKGNKPFEYDPIWKILRLSPIINSKENILYYLEIMQEFGARYIHGYPGTIALLSSNIKRYGFSVPFKLNAILFASESIYSWQRNITKEVFNCQIFSHYGQAEKVVLAGECENNTYYHCIPQYGITEIDPTTNEIIGTSFLNYINPFIRYRTTDIVSQPVSLGCNKCSRYYYPVFSSVEGRLEDFIITPEGIPVSPAVITHPFKKLKTIKETQIIQKSLNYIKVNVVPWDDHVSDLLQSELLKLCQGLHKIFGSNMKIETDIIDSIQLSKSSKFKWIISDVSKDLLRKGII